MQNSSVNYERTLGPPLKAEHHGAPPDHLLLAHPSFSADQGLFCRLLATSKSLRAAIMHEDSSSGLLAV